VAFLALAASPQAQTLINVDFGVGMASLKTGLAATGMGTNDYWNLYRHYQPRFTAGMALVANGKLDKLKLADGTESGVSVAVNNAPGVWGNSSGDPMYDTYVFAQNGSNITVAISGLAPGRYHFYCYGHAEPDVTGEQNSVFTLKAGTNTFGPMTQMGGGGWKAGKPWQERAQYIVFRDVPVDGAPVILDVAPGPNGVAVLNGLQISSRGTSPPRLLAAGPQAAAPASTNLLFREIRYDGKVSDTEARFAVAFDVESMTTNEISAPLFEGEVALVSPVLPDALRIVSQGRQTRLFCTAPGSYPVKLELIAKITKAEPWNQISFIGPPAAIASVTASASTPGVEMQLLSGTQLEPEKKATSKVSGYLGSDRTLSMRWQSKAAEVTRKSLVTVDTAASALITPTVIKFTTALHYEILQAAVPRLTVALPATHALTRIQGEQIRDWQVKPDGERQVLTIEFIKPVEKACAVTLFSEQTVETTPLAATLVPPQPLEVERESGSFILIADDTTVEIDSAPGLRQVNAPTGSLAAYRFNGRPVSVKARIQRIAPMLKLADRVTARLEETRLLVSHALNLSVEKAGIYALDLAVPPGFVASEVKGEGIDDWKTTDGILKISFASRVLGARKIDIQLEQANREFPDKITVLPLAVTGATNVTTQLGAASSPGIRLKTAELTGLREVPITSFPARSDELLAFVSEQPDWKLTLAAEKLSARVVAEVFNLVTIGDGVVGGSATIRYGIINQGVQEFRIALPAHWKNVEFTGANIRRKEQQTNVWTITLQDKAWGGYTLVLTYDYQFDPKGSVLDLAGAHTLGVERETGSLGVMTAASLKLTPAAPAEPLRRVDEAELSESDRALCTRPLLLAYKYTGGDYQHTAQVTRFEEVKVLEAVADRIELTTVLTDEGQLLTQSSFMVKNNEKQFQKFKLSQGAEFWSSYVNGQPAKPERDGEWLLVPLPRDANRDQAFAVDIVYAQKISLKQALFPRRVVLAAPLTDIPNTYAEWQLFVPVSQRLSSFDGNMTVARGTTYELRDAWQEFIRFYWDLIEHNFGMIAFGIVIVLVLVLVGAAIRRGAQGLLTVLCVLGIVAILAAMLLPALSRAKSKAQRISAVNSLKQIGLAARTWGIDNGDAMPPSFEAMKNELGTDKITYDPNTGQRFVYVGAGKSAANPEAIIAYSPSDQNGRAVAFADGSVQVMSAEKFQEALARDAALPRVATAVNAVVAGQMPTVDVNLAPPPAAPPVQPPAESAAAQEALAHAAQPAAPTTAPMRLPQAGALTLGGGQQAEAALRRPRPRRRPRACAPYASKCRAPASRLPSPKSSTPARSHSPRASP
jgi:type II secretory pathway pseudopilin PulG